MTSTLHNQLTECTTWAPLAARPALPPSGEAGLIGEAQEKFLTNF